MHKITEIIPDSIPDWAKDAMDDGQFFRIALERIASLEAQLKSQEDYVTHHNDWLSACNIARCNATNRDDADYWAHQINTLARLSPPITDKES